MDLQKKKKKGVYLVLPGAFIFIILTINALIFYL